MEGPGSAAGGHGYAIVSRRKIITVIRSLFEPGQFAKSAEESSDGARVRFEIEKQTSLASVNTGSQAEQRPAIRPGKKETF